MQTREGGGGGGTPLYGPNGEVRPIRVSAYFCFQRGIDFTIFALNRVSLHLNGKRVHLNLGKLYKKPNLYPFLLALMPEACAITKLDQTFLV